MKVLQNLKQSNRDSTVHHQKRGDVESVVRTTEITSYSKVNLQSKTPAESRQQDGEEHINFHNSRVEVLKAATSFQFPDCDPQTINLITGTVRKSSEDDYQRKWKFFLEYVYNKGIAFNDIVKSVVLSFLSHLFHVKRLKPSTISHYRSALSRPLLEYFNRPHMQYSTLHAESNEDQKATRAFTKTTI